MISHVCERLFSQNSHRHCELLFSEDLPLFSSLGTFELGIIAPDNDGGAGGGSGGEVDIDSAIRKAAEASNSGSCDKDEKDKDNASDNRNDGSRMRPKSVTISSPSHTTSVTRSLLTPTVEVKKANDGGSDSGKFHSVVSLERSRSSVSSLLSFGSSNSHAHGHAHGHLAQLQQFKSFLQQQAAKLSIGAGEDEDVRRRRRSAAAAVTATTATTTATEAKEGGFRPKRRLLKVGAPIEKEYHF